MWHGLKIGAQPHTGQAGRSRSGNRLRLQFPRQPLQIRAGGYVEEAGGDVYHTAEGGGGCLSVSLCRRRKVHKRAPYRLGDGQRREPAARVRGSRVAGRVREFAVRADVVGYSRGDERGERDLARTAEWRPGGERRDRGEGEAWS